MVRQHNLQNSDGRTEASSRWTSPEQNACTWPVLSRMQGLDGRNKSNLDISGDIVGMWHLQLPKAAQVGVVHAGEAIQLRDGQLLQARPPSAAPCAPAGRENTPMRRAERLELCISPAAQQHCSWRKGG